MPSRGLGVDGFCIAGWLVGNDDLGRLNLLSSLLGCSTSIGLEMAGVSCRFI